MRKVVFDGSRTLRSVRRTYHGDVHFTSFRPMRFALWLLHIVPAVGALAVSQAPNNAKALRRLVLSDATRRGSIKHNLGRVPARLAAAQSECKPAVALLIAGSGPTDRDGDAAGGIGRAAPLRLLAEALADADIASVRYDKRGVGASHVAPSRLSSVQFDTLVSDAISWIKLLRRDQRFSRVVVIGHSEGALIGTIAASHFPGTPVILLAGAGRPGSAILRIQLRSAPPPIRAAADTILAANDRGYVVSRVPSSLRYLLPPNAQRYLIGWSHWDPAQELKTAATLGSPILIVQGTNDIQVSLDDADRLAAAAGRAGTLAIVDSMTHDLKIASDNRESQMRTYVDPTLPLAPKLRDVVVEFIKRHTCDYRPSPTSTDRCSEVPCKP